MTIIRRIYDLPTGESQSMHSHQIMVTHDDTTGELLVGHRRQPWDEWSRPMTHVVSEDDPPMPGRYGPDGLRRYDPVPAEELDAPGPADA